MDVARGLAAAHARGIIHRDLKPDNVVITSAGEAKILDFSLAAGSPLYMSPEQAMGKAADARSDVFSFGVLLYEMLTGTTPFTGDAPEQVAAAIVRDEPEPTSMRNPRTPPPLERIIDRCLSKNPADRYASGKELVDAFEHPPAGPPSPARRSRFVQAAMGVGLFILVGALALALRSRSSRPHDESKAPPSGEAAKLALPTSLAALPLPESASEEALAAYRRGIEAMHGARWVPAREAFAQAIAQDAGMAAASLRLAIAAGLVDGDAAAARQAYAQAHDGRARLSERDAALLDALEPLFLTRPRSVKEAARRLGALAEGHPKDAEIQVLLARTLVSRPDDALSAAQRAIEIDAQYADALRVEGDAFGGLARPYHARTAYESCVAASSESADCVSQLAWLDAADGRCDAFDADARRLATWAHDDPFDRPAVAAYALGRPRDGVLAASRKRPLDEARIAAAFGDFARAKEKGLEAAAQRSTELAARYAAIVPLVELAEETHDDASLSAASTEFVTGAEIWSRDGGASPLADPLTPWLLRTAVDAGVLSHAEFEKRRKQWIDRTRDEDDAPAGLLWIASYAAPAASAGEAQQALAALPDGAIVGAETTWLSEAQVGHAYLLAGRVDDAIPFLQRAASSCLALEDVFVHTRALLDLGTALEKKGDKAGACVSYKRVVDRWGRAKPKSSTADAARARVTALGC
jgi:eukaryotic-like serine/threonine-protein kinase